MNYVCAVHRPVATAFANRMGWRAENTTILTTPEQVAKLNPRSAVVWCVDDWYMLSGMEQAFMRYRIQTKVAKP